MGWKQRMMERLGPNAFYIKSLNRQEMEDNCHQDNNNYCNNNNDENNNNNDNNFQYKDKDKKKKKKKKKYKCRFCRSHKVECLLNMYHHMEKCNKHYKTGKKEVEIIIQCSCLLHNSIKSEADWILHIN